MQSDTAFAGSPLDDLQPPTEFEDTSVIKSCFDVFAHLVARLAKLFFTEGKFPSRYKTASVTPLLKKKELDPDVASNYRPISDLRTISKMLERLFMASRPMRPHIESCANFNRYLSAYRRGHSTETTLLRILDDVYHAAENHSRSLLLQLDLPAAFDALDKPTLLRRLDHTFGVRDTSHKWVDSYLNERQYLRVGDRVSASVSCHYGVPQGSVLGPLLFTICTSPTVSVIAHFRNVHHAQYADDTQTIHRSQHWQGTQRHQRLFPVRPSLVGRQRAV